MKVKIKSAMIDTKLRKFKKLISLKTTFVNLNSKQKMMHMLCFATFKKKKSITNRESKFFNATDFFFRKQASNLFLDFHILEKYLYLYSIKCKQNALLLLFLYKFKSIHIRFIFIFKKIYNVQS